MSAGGSTGAAPDTNGDADVVIVGARVAGSSLAALLARGGLRVVVLDQATTIGFTLSSNIVQADSLAFLDRLGLTERLRAAGLTTMDQVDMRLEDFRAVLPFPTRPGDVGGAACLRRQVLDPLLVEAAREAGADVRLGVKVRGLLRGDDGRVVGVRTAERGGGEATVRARLVVGADGRASTVARLAGARQYHVTRNERAYYWTYFEGADTGEAPTFVFHRWGDRHLLGGPADNGLYIVGVSPEQHERETFHDDLEGSLMAHALSCAPIAKAIGGANRASRVFGIRRFSGYFREASGPGWVLLGDAGHFKDPAGGRGIGDSFHQAERLAPAVTRAVTENRRDAELDRLCGEFGRWRDRVYAEYYGLASDLGVAGPIASVVPEVVRRLHARGQGGRVLDLLSHRVGVLGVLTPGRVAGATGRLLLRGGGRRALLSEVRALGGTEIRRRRAMRRPAYAPVPPHAETELSA
ncbi:NAD(P)/FAD-dependent oxidoreductase [Streptomyces sp. NBRC 109706]|uniref:NAD(P)/FAD-dependent oxidoreductase n=1 Tax=Streptomyces sp. NBRC 109706 TaxID=1550035 RepID=UPI000781E2D7|nr:NAD(P)/FAD-dependent oxidoreductase [Streptomyces sp. NBRC 109706]